MSTYSVRTPAMFVAATLLALSAGAHAQAIIEATGITASAGLPLDMPPPFALSHIIDQSGLSATYQSGVTNFDDFASTTFHCALCTSLAVQEGGVAKVGSDFGTITFDLGSVTTIDKIAVWNDLGIASLRSFDLVADGVTLGSYDMAAMSTVADVGSVFAFAPVTTETLEMVITGNFGDPLGTMINEVAFESAPTPVAAVPEPATPALFLGGLGAIGLFVRRRTPNGPGRRRRLPSLRCRTRAALQSPASASVGKHRS